MGLFSEGEPVIVKKDSSAKAQLTQLESLRGTLPAAAEKELDTDIRALRAGITGEDRILYELKNSHMEMFVLQDLFLEHDGLTAQIDFLVITPRRIFVIECKNLFGDIEVNNRGDFIRSFGGRKKEGIYSPITQNQRHIELIHAMKKSDRSFVENVLLDGDFDDTYRGLVVLANPKTVLNDRYAKKEIKEQIIRADQLITTMKAINDEKGPGNTKKFRSAIQGNAEWFVAQHKENPTDYTAKYRELAVTREREERGSGASILCPRCGAPMVLRTARRGDRAGKQFYGCSKYPACKGIVNIDS